MPTKKNRGTESRNFPIRSLAENLGGQPTHAGFGTPGNPHSYLFDAIQNGSEVKGGGSSAVGRLAHGTGDVPNKVSLPKHSGKKTRG
ncbi:MAG: hypothetical protein WAK55_17370, partial [Xanthobacteraceae bacterium]